VVDGAGVVVVVVDVEVVDVVVVGARVIEVVDAARSELPDEHAESTTARAAVAAGTPRAPGLKRIRGS
jgi:hypothetical protein